MKWSEAFKIIKSGGKVRRPAWQPGYIENGIFQEKETIFYVVPEDDKIIIGGLRVTWTPQREDPHATDWEIYKHGD